VKRLTVTSGLTTGLNPSFGAVRVIDIEDAPIGQGAFGIAYRALAFDGLKVQPQVVKLLSDEPRGAAARGYGTIQELQRRLGVHDLSLRAVGTSLLQRHPALVGFAHFSFDGLLEGRPVVGYAANDLVALGMEDFANILSDDAKARRLQQLPLSVRMSLATQLVDAMEFLSTRANYIHADVKPEAIFLNLAQGSCALIDFDSGVVMRGTGDRPTTFGTRQDWLAPEIVEQLDRPGNTTRIVKVDLLSDVWSVNIAVHYLLFGFSPLFFLTEVSRRSMREYLRRYRWPDADPGFQYFRRDYGSFHANYVRHLRGSIPSDITNRFSFTMNNGYSNPAARTSYGQWKSALAAQNRPAILRFTANTSPVVDMRPVCLEWAVTGAHRLHLSGVGDVTGRTSVDVQVRRDTTFTLVLTPLSGPPLSQSVSVEVSKAPPTVHWFRSTVMRPQASPGVRLEWSVSGADRLTIDRGVGDVSGLAHIDLSEPRSGKYTLTATSPFGTRAVVTTSIKRFMRAGTSDQSLLRSVSRLTTTRTMLARTRNG
jgi:serine/threonine protein kinase